MSAAQIDALRTLYERLYKGPALPVSHSGLQEALMNQPWHYVSTERERLVRAMTASLAQTIGSRAPQTSTGISTTASCGLTTSKPESLTLTRPQGLTASLRTRVRRRLNSMLWPLRFLLAIPALFISALLTGLGYLLRRGTRRPTDFGRLLPPTS